MNETMQKVMEFINNHTLLLIGICVFLILVLIGYLIDNSVKSKRVRKDIKNADQVPENIKNEIIKEAQENTDVPTQNVVPTENSEIMTQPVAEPEVINTTQNVETVEPTIQEEVVAPIENNVDNSTQELVLDGLDSSLDLDKTLKNINLEMPTVDSKTENFNFDIDNSTPVDPDLNIMTNTTVSEYSNDKKLSDILMNINNTQTSEIDTNIFSSNEPNIVMNDEIKKEDIQIEDNNSPSELDKIMEKLSSYDDDSQEDNYTNIF